MTSVPARTPAARAASAAAALSVVIVATTAAACSAVAASRLIAVVRIPMPSGFVRTSDMPGRSPSLRISASAGAKPIATIP